MSKQWSEVDILELHLWQQKRIRLYKELVALGTHEQKAVQMDTTVNNIRNVLYRAGQKYGEKREGGVYAAIRKENLERVRKSLEAVGYTGVDPQDE